MQVLSIQYYHVRDALRKPLLPTLHSVQPESRLAHNAQEYLYSSSFTGELVAAGGTSSVTCWMLVLFSADHHLYFDEVALYDYKVVRSQQTAGFKTCNAMLRHCSAWRRLPKFTLAPAKLFSILATSGWCGP
eukprot:1518202-Amphidinium_carterae.1